MPRNFRRRVELMFPIEDPTLRTRLIDRILGVVLSDNVKARELQPDGTYRRIKPQARRARHPLPDRVPEHGPRARRRRPDHPCRRAVSLHDRDVSEVDPGRMGPQESLQAAERGSRSARPFYVSPGTAQAAGSIEVHLE